jgi:hypothetical protein
MIITIIITITIVVIIITTTIMLAAVAVAVVVIDDVYVSFACKDAAATIQQQTQHFLLRDASHAVVQVGALIMNSKNLYKY